MFTHLRAGAESGWDFSSRWFADGENLHTIHTTDIVRVDLNCLLYTLKNIIAKAKAVACDEQSAQLFSDKALNRKNAILKYCWNSNINFFYDYDFVVQQQLHSITVAGLLSLFVIIAISLQARFVAEKTASAFLKNGIL